jgi:hypothetical protein
MKIAVEDVGLGALGDGEDHRGRTVAPTAYMGLQLVLFLQPGDPLLVDADGMLILQRNLHPSVAVRLHNLTLNLPDPSDQFQIFSTAFGMGAQELVVAAS